MNSAGNHARRCSSYEKEELDTLSKWIKSMREMLISRIRLVKLKCKSSIPPCLVSKPDVVSVDTLQRTFIDWLHVEYVLVLAHYGLFVCLF
jgi:hypothetical protein